MKKVRLIVFSLFILLITACSSDDPNDRKVSSNEEQKTATPKEVVKEDPKEKPVGTRSNPLPFGDTITVKSSIYDSEYNALEAKVELTGLEVIRGEEAWDLILKENQFNEPAAEGYEWILVKVKGTVSEAETDDDYYWLSASDFSFVSEEGKVYELVSAVIPNELNAELYNGGSSEGFVYGQVEVDNDVKLSYGGGEGSPVFFFLK